MTETKYGIVAACDGSPAGCDALRWAAREARGRGTLLTIFLGTDLMVPGEPKLQEVIDQARHQGRHALANGLGHAASVVPANRIRVEVTGHPPAEELCERSQDAGLVVLGSRGDGTLPGLPLGSVAWKVAACGHGRLVVVRGRWRAVNDAPGPVVVGLDGSAPSADAAAFAFEEARLRHVSLVAVCALADSPLRLGQAHQLEDRIRNEIAAYEEKYPDVTIMRQITAGQPRSALLATAQQAQLVVVGSRGRGGVEGMLLGSVTQALLHHSPCPVGVVHPD
jgi:nucleotide-binding universal stress UspA family protein